MAWIDYDFGDITTYIEYRIVECGACEGQGYTYPEVTGTRQYYGSRCRTCYGIGHFKEGCQSLLNDLEIDYDV